MLQSDPSLRRPLRHRLAAFLLAVWLVLLGGIGVPLIATAQGPAPQQVIIIDDIPARIREDVQRAMKDSFGFQAQLAIINALQFFGERFAYETAVWLASGGTAQSALFNRETALNFLFDSALGAGLQFVDDMDKYAGDQLGFEGGFGIAQFVCGPTIPELKLSIKLGLQDRLHARQPLCTLQQLRGNWDAFTDQGLAGALSGIGIAFEPGESDLSAGLELHVGLGEKQATTAFTKLTESLANKGFKPLGEKISGLTKTPASTVEGTLNETVVKTPKDAKKTTAEQTSTALAAQDTFFPMLKAAGQALAVNFAVTLVSQTLQRQLLNKGLFLGSLFDSGSGTEESVAPPAAREQQARTVFAELQRPPFVSSGDYDQLSEFASCDPQRRQLTTCVIDEGFTQAVRRSQTGAPITVAEAVTEGLLHTDWPLIRAGTAKDQDPNCAKGPPTGGYCASNLGKLRRARIVPIGWELAANHEANNVGDPVRLGQVIDAFQRNGIDGRCGTSDAEESPYCGLIDPNWVLTYPSQQCQLRGPGEQLLERGAAVRAEACVDVPSCLERDAEGKCVGGYGYCVREKNIWHLAGQSCPGQYASCRAFTSREGASLAALTATIDRGVCTAENVGCRWYAASRDAVGSWESTNRRYLNRLAEQCTEANEGCTELIPTKTARRNIVSNPSFERNADGIGSPDDWALISDIVLSTDGTRTADGSVAIQVTNTDFADRPVDERIPLTDDRSYVLSASALRNPGGVATPKLRVVLVFKDTLTGAGGSPAVAGMQTTCTKGTPASPEGGDGGDPNAIALYIDPGAATGYVRGSCTFVAPTNTQSAYVQIYSTEANPIWADAIQIEEGTEPSPFHEGYDPNASRTYLKAASDDLRCYDVGGDGQLNTANDHESCPSFALGCTEAEVGCERYTPADGTPAVNGQANDIDRCPAECAGYAAFREVESNFDRKSAFDSFIPSTARQCAAEQIGCSEFTNLDALERGGEQREYFSFLRQCEKPGESATATYYTWEGSDSQGFQLRSFVLRPSTSDVNSAPHTFDGSGDCSGSTDAIVRADCRAFYSQDGTIHPRQLSRTVIITDDCVRYRATHDTSQLVTSSGTACSLASDTCKEVCAWAGGTFAGGACVFKGHRQESRQCSAAAAGCRAYRGNASGVVQTLLDSSFEATSGDVREGWSPLIGSQSSEALTVGQHSLRVPLSSTTAHSFAQTISGFTAAQCTERAGVFTAAVDDVPSTCEVSSLALGHTYEVLLTGKGRGQVEVSLTQTGTALTTPVTHPVTLGPTWQLLRVGPLIVDQQPTSVAQLQLTVGAGGDAFFDQIILREVPQLTTVVKGSWVTPQQCDRASIAQDAPPLAQGMLGCRAYRPRSGPAVTLRSFSRLCSESVVGCTAFHDTKNSVSLDAASFNTGTPVTDDVTVPADTLRYLVNDPAKSCAATAKGCSRFGKPTLDRIADRNNPPATAWTDTFFIDHPDRYTGPGAILCTHPALFCEEYRGQDGTVIYFKDPGSRTCEYRENVAKTGGSPASGWFKSNVDPPQACDPGLLIGGATYGIWNNADPNYAGWAGMCEASYDHCTRFVDPADRAPAYPNGNPYHAIRTTVDFASCQGSVSQKEGCVVLSDSSDPGIRFSAEASIAASDVQQGARVPALNCDQDPESCSRCRVPRRCRAPDGHVQGDRAGEPASPASCLSDGDCVTAAGFRCRGGEAGPTCTTDANCASFGIPGEATCSTFTNDGNAIIKVQRDRSCGQWLACQSATEARDPGLQRSIEVCGSIALCDSYLPEGGGSTALRCGHWLSTAETDGQILTRSLYQQRSRGWTGQDYSGYSVSGIYQAQDLTPVDVSLKRGEIDIRLARLDPGCWGTTTTRAAPLSSVPCDREQLSSVTGELETVRASPGTCGGLTGDQARDDPATNFDDSRIPSPCGAGGLGVCVNHKCVYGIDGAPLVISGVIAPSATAAPALECRVYPEADAPFSPEVAEFKEVRFSADEVGHVRTGSKISYSSANTCEFGEGRCGCAYQKVRYGDAVRYYDQASSVAVPSGICDGGFTAGNVAKAGAMQCSADEECQDERPFASALINAHARCIANGNSDTVCDQQATAAVEGQRQHGKCKLQDRRERFLGLSGVCLERDQSIEIEDDPSRHPCVSWYPVQQLAGGTDLYNQFERAGFHEEAQYCTNVTRYEHRKYIEGASITSCEIGTAMLVCSGASIAGPGAVVGCLVGALAGAAGATAILNATEDICGIPDVNYTYHDYEVDWRAPWPFGSACPPFFDIDFICKPTGGVGWYQDSGGTLLIRDCADDSPTPCGNEERAFRCTEVTDVADLPTPDDTNNIAWTDRARAIANPEEEFRVQRTNTSDSAPEHPIRYRESCSVFGQLPSDIRPGDDVGEGETKEYWEVFPDSPEETLTLQQCDAAGGVTSNTPSSGGVTVASAARHWESIVGSGPGAGKLIGGLRGLFVDIKREWEWASTTEIRQCSSAIAVDHDNNSDTPPQAQTPRCEGPGTPAICREGGTCGNICRVVAGRCKVTRTYSFGTGTIDQDVPVGVVCTSDAACGGAAGSCVRSRYDPSPPGPPFELVSCTGTDPCVFPPLITTDGGVRFCDALDDCEVSRSGGSPRLEVPDGTCELGCTNPTSLGDACAVASDCTVQGECLPLPPDQTPEEAGQFGDRGNAFEHLSALSGTRTVGSGQGEPEVASVIACAADGTAGCAGAKNTLSVNGRNVDDVEASGGLATLEFFGWANRNQMPIREVKVRWGDLSEESGGPGKYQNHKPVCATGEDLSTSALYCASRPELTCDATHPCPTGAGACQGAYCRVSCTETADCPAGGTGNPTVCDGGLGACVRQEKRCLTSIGTPTETMCADDSTCAGADNACVDVAGTVLHRAAIGPLGPCTVTIGAASFGEGNTRVGVTSFGNFPDACTTTPFRYRHTYRCDGVTDPSWDTTLGGCVFIPAVRVSDNWRWCTKAGGAESPRDNFCAENDNAWIPFGGRVIVR